MTIFPVMPTAEIVPGVFTVSCRMVNFYLVKGPEGVLAVDSGVSQTETSGLVKLLGIDPTQVSAVFLTHSDYDHTGGLSDFPQARLYMGEAEAPLVSRQVRRMFGRFNAPLPRPASLLTDGQVIQEAGLTVEAITTPGHTPGSTSYRIHGKWLFTGDTVRLVRGRAIPFIRLINMNTTLQVQSIRKLAQLEGIELLGTAHYGVSRDFEGAMRAWRS